MIALLTADAICLEARAHSCSTATDLSSADIVGKPCARLLPICAFVICGLPVMAICFDGYIILGGFSRLLDHLGVAGRRDLGAGTFGLVHEAYEVLLGSYVF